MEYFDYNNTKSSKLDIHYQFIVGQRSNGKSYSVGKYVVEQCLKEDKQFIFLVGNVFEADKKQNYFAESVPQIELKSNKYYIDKKCVGYHMCLSLDDDYKSNQYPNVKYIIREEFIKQDFTDYIDNEIQHFQSILSTVFRTRSGTVFLIGNTLDTIYNNPYFTYFGIDFNKLKIKQGDELIIKNPNKATVSIIYCQNMYTNENEIPIMQQIPNNTVATSGELIKPPYIIDRQDFIKLMELSRNSGIRTYSIGAFQLLISNHDILVDTKVKSIHFNQRNNVFKIFDDYSTHTFYFANFLSYEFFFNILGIRLLVNRSNYTKELKQLRKTTEIDPMKCKQKKCIRGQKKKIQAEITTHNAEIDKISLGFYGDSLALQEYLISTHLTQIDKLIEKLNNIEV